MLRERQHLFCLKRLGGGALEHLVEVPLEGGLGAIYCWQAILDFGVLRPKFVFNVHRPRTVQLIDQLGFVGRSAQARDYISRLLECLARVVGAIPSFEVFEILQSRGATLLLLFAFLKAAVDENACAVRRLVDRHIGDFVLTVGSRFFNLHLHLRSSALSLPRTRSVVIFDQL